MARPTTQAWRATARRSTSWCSPSWPGWLARRPSSPASTTCARGATTASPPTRPRRSSPGPSPRSPSASPARRSTSAATVGGASACSRPSSSSSHSRSCSTCSCSTQASSAAAAATGTTTTASALAPPQASPRGLRGSDDLSTRGHARINDNTYMMFIVCVVCVQQCSVALCSRF